MSEYKIDVPEDFLNGYISCAIWSSNDENEIPLDENYDVSDIDEDTLMEMREECVDFYNANKEELKKTGCDDMSQHGHDFWLTRNGHGAGFWDRGYRNGTKLSDAAKVYGSFDLYVGDDGMVYGS